MNSAIFLRRETYGRTCQLKVGSTGQRRHDLSSIINEALRVPGYVPHVASPKILTLIANGPRDARSLGRKVIGHAKSIRTTDSLGRRRPLHPATHVLCSDVVSTPVPVSVTKENPDLLARVMTFFQSALVWVKKDIEVRGGQVLQAIIHLDEAHWHMHVLSISNCGFAKTLHPGFVAKERKKDELTELGIPKGEANAVADEAYRSAVRKFLDSFHMEVGYHLELARRTEATKPRESYAEVQRQARAARDEARLSQEQLANEAEQVALCAAAIAARAADEAHSIECERLALRCEREMLDREERQLESRQGHLDDGRRENLVAEADLARRETRLARTQSDLDARVAKITAILKRPGMDLTSPELERIRKRLQAADPTLAMYFDERLVRWSQSLTTRITVAWTAQDCDRRLEGAKAQVFASADDRVGETALEAVLRRHRAKKAHKSSSTSDDTPVSHHQAVHIEQFDDGPKGLSPSG